jgi:nucleoside-diphosphate-sugar epimerase
MKVLLTGAAGLIGKEILNTLVAEGHEVVATDRFQFSAPASVKTSVGDLMSIEFAESLDFDCDAVIHMGSIPSPLGGSDEVVIHNNVMGTYHLFAAAVEKKVPLVIYASSLSIYGTAWSGPWTSPEYVPFDEKLPLNHYESYALSKEVNERSADMWANRGETAFVGLRFPYCNSEAAIADFAEKMKQGDKETVLTGAKILWCYLDLRDAAHGVLTILKKGAKGSATYNFLAPDTNAPKPTMEMLAEFHPTTKVNTPLPGYATIVDCSAWEKVYGYKPKHLFKRG